MDDKGNICILYIFEYRNPKILCGRNDEIYIEYQTTVIISTSIITIICYYYQLNLYFSRLSKNKTCRTSI